MSNKRPALPAYVRLPDGLRFAGTADLSEEGLLCFYPKQAISPLPPGGLPVHLIIAGLPDDDDAQLSISGTIDAVSAREMRVGADDPLPDVLIETLDPDSIVWLPSPEEAQVLLEKVRALGQEQLMTAMQRFLVELGDQLFDLSTSARYGISGQHAHYDALNMLKRNSEQFVATYQASILATLDIVEKDASGQSFADLEKASARSLDLVALDEMDQKLAVDKIVSKMIEKHRVELECLTIRAALVADLEPRKARTPFHPAYITEAFSKAFEPITDNTVVVQDALKFFREKYIPVLDTLYPALNAIFIEAGVEPGLEEDIVTNGSLLNPVEKRIIKSEVRGRARSEGASQAGDDDRDDGQSNAREARGKQIDGHSDEQSEGQSHTQDDSGRGSAGAAESQVSAAGSGAPKNRHDAMYDAVLNALDTNRGADEEAIPDKESVAAGELSSEGSDVAGASAGDSDRSSSAGKPIDQEQLLSTLLALQNAASDTQSLAELPPLESLIRERSGDEKLRLGRDGANRLSFIDNVFRTLHNNFEVSRDMAPSLAKLRVPLARLSLQEPKFFAQPEHPAHQLLDKLSMLASADHTVSRSLQKRVSEIVERIASDYRDDSVVFAEAQSELDGLLGKQDRVLEKNIQRVVSGLEGQEKLSRAQRRVEDMLSAQLTPDAAPAPLVELLEGGWRDALTQLALREDEDSIAWREEASLLESLARDLTSSAQGDLNDSERKEMGLRLNALNKRLSASNPGSLSHEKPIEHINQVLTGRAPLATTTYMPSYTERPVANSGRVEQLPRLRRWLKRVKALEPGAKLRYRDKTGRRRHMRLVWVSDDKEKYAFVNERGQKIAELSAVQLARQLSRGAQPPTPVDNMSVLDQSMYETLEQAQKTLSFDRNRDSLTKLINGDSLLYQLQRSLRHAQTRGSEHAFMLLNIDNFGLVNEVFDETNGDQVLVEFARLLGQLNDRRALTARMQEDEFGILLTYRSMEEAKRVGDKIREDIAKSSLSIGAEAVSFTVSIGIAPVVQSSESPQAIVTHARSALELAKTSGRDQVIVFNVNQQEVLDYMQEKDQSRKRLEEAMSTDGLVLRAQPIVKSAVDGRESAFHTYEILLALRQEDGSLEGPREFIRSAERFGYVTLVDRWVVRETFAWISTLMDTQKEVPELSINLSGTSITDNDFLDYVLEQISEYGVGTSKLCFEITETGAIDNLPRAADFVRTLKNIGCKFSLDDFGTGLASHKYLKELPVDFVKIDGTFITDVHKNSTDYAMAKSINDLAHFLGQKTIAECVEDLDIVPSLREIGVDYFQGWGIGMPRELSDITLELANVET
ncbi:MAG: hypothetical protein Cons2KO_21800 [Congregibacter sp.]